jgi:hypothetical protein
MLRRDLVGGRSGVQIGARRHLRVSSRQPRRAGARVIAGDFEPEAGRLLRVEPGERKDAVLEVRERLRRDVVWYPVSKQNRGYGPPASTIGASAMFRRLATANNRF